jgi:hypothetical protein
MPKDSAPFVGCRFGAVGTTLARFIGELKGCDNPNMSR